MKRTVITIAGAVLLVALGIYIRQIIHETVLTTIPGQRYVVSLGDSVAAGAGLSDTAGRKSGDCDTATSASAYLVGQRLHLPVEQFACSGATITAQTGANNVLHAQYKAAKQFLPHSDVVIYAGANDIGWLQLISGCVSTNCVTDQTRAALAAKLPALRENMITLVLQLRQQNPHRVIVNTYYSLLAPTDTCFAALGVTQDEVGFIAEQEALFNNTISSAAAQAGATAVNVDFSDHSLCSKQPWIQGISDKAPLHPNALGQQQIATQDAAAL